MNNNNRHRRSIRLRDYDYSQDGAYFVTICTKNRECCLGEIIDGQMLLTDAGNGVLETWLDLPRRFPQIELDEFVVMPNHIHGILYIMNKSNVGARFIAPHKNTQQQNVGVQFIAPNNNTKKQKIVGAQFIAPHRNTQQQNVRAQFIAPPFAPLSMVTGTSTMGAMNRAPTLGEMVRVLKAVSTRHIRQAGFDNFYWQRNYYERIIRDEAELMNIREYIKNNPLQWALDSENPDNIN